MTAVKKYIVFMKEDFEFTTRPNTTLEQAKKKYPDSVSKLAKGEILYSQKKPFTVEQIDEAKKEGIPYSWGFGPCYEMIKFKYMQFGKVKTFEV